METAVVTKTAQKPEMEAKIVARMQEMMRKARIGSLRQESGEVRVGVPGSGLSATIVVGKCKKNNRNNRSLALGPDCRLYLFLHAALMLA